MSDAARADEVRRLLGRADALHKAAGNRPDPAAGTAAAREVLERASALAGEVVDPALHDELRVQVGRRLDDLQREEHAATRADARPAGSADGPPLPQPGPVTLDPPPRSGDARVPPGQHLVRGLPVLHVGSVPVAAVPGPDDRALRVTGAVAGRWHEVTWAQLRALPAVDVVVDVHCVTAWSRLDAAWTGVRVRDLLASLGGPTGSATHALAYGANAYSANLDLATLLRDDTLLAWAFDGAPLAPEHGGPLRLVVPSRYFWKSTKWLERVQLLERDVPGYWEARGYHNVADPFLEQRYA